MEHTDPAADALPLGYVETLSPEFAAGWARYTEGVPSHVYALLDGRVVGTAVADEVRGDLGVVAAEQGWRAGGFLIVFARGFSAEERARVFVHVIGATTPLARSSNMRLDRDPLVQIFVLGSPRSGTSEMGATLAGVLQLPWRGELHAAQLFAGPAEALRAPSPVTEEALARYLADHHLSRQMMRLARQTYYGVHGSASFVDKTPGVEMIGAAPFLADCFPSARFIYLRRNGVSNVLSRVAKFGGSFSEHCADWAEALMRWARVRDDLPHYLEIRQEDMLTGPAAVARQIALYLDMPERVHDLTRSLTSGRLERTGAGVGRHLLHQTGWDETQITIFRQICGPVMTAFGYDM